MSKIIILVTGSRSITDQAKVWEKLDSIKTSLLPNQVIGLVEGDAAGVDKICGDWAVSCGIARHKVSVSSQDWEDKGKQAGILRNIEMFRHAKDLCDLNDALLHPVAFWDGSSSGTQHMINSIKKDGYHVEVHLMGKPKTKRLI